MPKRKEDEQFADRGEKDCWHAYSLQMLHPTKFSLVVGNILKGNYSLIVSKLQKDLQQKAN